jgi:predicted kinase
MSSYVDRDNRDPLRLPLLVLVTGAPGGGKTTLAARLATELSVPHLNRDLVGWGMWVTDGDRRREQAWDVWIESIHVLLRARASCVVDQTMYAGSNDVAFRCEVEGRCLVVNVHVRAENARERWEAKARANPRYVAGELGPLLARWDTARDEFTEPMDFGGAQIVVDTTDPMFPIEPLAQRVWDEALLLDARR